MARVTVEDCIDKVDSPYELVLVAKERATQLNSGIEPLLDRDNDSHRAYVKTETKLKIVKIKKKMGWCDDPNHKNYNQLVNNTKRIKCEKLFRKDSKYDFVLPIEYNSKKIAGKGSCIFIHLTKNYKATAGCIALKKK